MCRSTVDIQSAPLRLGEGKKKERKKKKKKPKDENRMACPIP